MFFMPPLLQQESCFTLNIIKKKSDAQILNGLSKNICKKESTTKMSKFTRMIYFIDILFFKKCR